MDVLNDLPIDWANVNWPYVFVSVLLVFLCALIGTSLSFRRTFLGAVFTALQMAFVILCREEHIRGSRVGLQGIVTVSSALENGHSSA
jgi:hypothetical protein